MPLKNYGVLKGRPVDRRLGTTANAHYQVHIVDDTTDYRIAINVQSKLSPSELEYLIDDQFEHPFLADLAKLKSGWNTLDQRPGGLAIDFIRGNFFDRERMRPLPFNVPGPDNDLNEAIDKHIQLALSDEDAMVYAFGERWGPERNTKDKIFGFLPGNGVHDIHMNQGNDPKFADQDGVWQDGALLIHFPGRNQWVGIFLKFQSQTWHTDDKTGHRLNDKAEPDGTIRIVAALVNPAGPAPEREVVTLINTLPEPVDLTGWKIADRLKNKYELSGVIQAGATLTITLPQSVQLGNKGGIITLLNREGWKVHGVSYSKEQADREGWTIVF